MSAFLACSGITPSASPTNAHFAALKAMGFRHLRLINVDFDMTVNADGSVSAWSPVLLNGLQKCRDYGFAVHLISGQAAMAGLATFTKSSTGWPTDFPEAQYRGYIRSLLNYVCVTNGFSAIRLEIGNEFDGGTPWYLTGALTDAVRYSAYCKLFWIWSTEVSAWLAAHPGVTVNLGGYAGTSSAWLTKFATDTLPSSCPKRDFLSCHFYLRGEGLNSFLGNLSLLRKYYPTLPLYLTEVGYDPFNSANATGVKLNTLPEAYYWMKMFYACGEAWGINEAYLLQTIAQDCALWMADGVSLNQHGRAVMEAIQ